MTVLPLTNPSPNPDLVVLVDALVEAIDTDRTEEVERVQDALKPFGGSDLLAAELRLNGRSSEHVWSLLVDFGAEAA